MNPAVSLKRQLLIVTLALGVTGCLDFEKQTVVIVFPPDSKEMHCLLLYEGLCVGGAKDKDLAEAKTSLTNLVNNDEDFYVGSNFWHLSQKVSAIPDETETRVCAFLRKHLTIRRGAFFLDKEDRLCFYQIVTIKDRDRFVEELNPIIAGEMAESAERWLKDKETRPKGWDEEACLRIKKAAANKKYAWVQLEPGRVCFTYPATLASGNQIRREFFAADDAKALHELVQSKKETDLNNPANRNLLRTTARNLENQLKCLLEMPLSFDQRHDKVIFAVGVGGGQPIRLPFPAEEKKRNGDQEKALLETARTLKAPFKKDLTAEQVVNEFLKQHPTSKEPD